MRAEEQKKIAGNPVAGNVDIVLLRSYDWSQTPLGEIETWSEDLKTAVHSRLTELNQAQIEQMPQKLALPSQYRTQTALRQTTEADGFRIALSDALRLLTDANEIQAIAARMLGESLEVSRVIYLEVLPESDEVIIRKNYTNGVAELSGRYCLKDFGRNLTEDHRFGRTVIIPDVTNSFEYTESEKASYQALDIAAHLDVPLIKNNQFVALLAVHQATPREWTDFEVQQIEETAERTWAAVECARAEAALRESEAKYRQLFESIAQGFCTVTVLFDADGKPFDHRILHANLAFERQTGLSHPEGKTASELAPGVEQYWNDLYAQVIHTGESIRTEIYSDTFNCWFDVLVSPVGDVTTCQVAVVFTDISDRKQTEVALQRTSAELERQVRKFNATLSTLTDSVFTFDRESRFLYANQVLLDLWGITAAESIGKTMVQLDYPAAVERQVLDDLQRVFKTEKTVRNETPYTNPAGVESYFEYILSPVFAADSTVESVVGSARDISERKQIEATLQARNERLNLLSEVANDLLLNEDPKIFLAPLLAKVSVHLGLEVFFNYLYEVDCQHLQLHAHGGISEEIAASDEVLELGQGVCGYVVQHRQPTVVENALSSTNPLAVSIQSMGIRAYASHPLIVGDRVLGTLGMGTRQRDRFTQDELDLMQVVTHQVAAALERVRLVTELQTRAEALTQTNRIKDEFLAVLSHELRTPLNPILGWARLLQSGKIDAARQKDALATIERNAQLQLQLIEDLLDISRIMQGKLTLSVATHNTKRSRPQ